VYLLIFFLSFFIFFCPPLIRLKHSWLSHEYTSCPLKLPPPTNRLDLTQHILENYINTSPYTTQTRSVQGIGHAMYVQRKIQARSRNHCCRRKAIIITYSERGSAALVTQRAKAYASYYVVTCGLQGDTTCFHIISLTAGFSKKKKVSDIKCVFLYYLQILSETSLILRRGERHSSYYHKCAWVFM